MTIIDKKIKVEGIGFKVWFPISPKHIYIDVLNNLESIHEIKNDAFLIYKLPNLNIILGYEHIKYNYCIIIESFIADDFNAVSIHPILKKEMITAFKNLISNLE